MEDYKKILQIQVHNIVDRLQNGLIHPYTAKQEIFKKAINYTHSCKTLKKETAEQLILSGVVKSDSEQLQGFFDYYKKKFGGGFNTEVLEITLKQYKETL
tara:strand:+ start:128 stop:427 length:300 start_codon:yes stop_codon:yes gene_type:complete